MPPFTDEGGITWYPVRHALGSIVCSLSRESQQRWQEYADKQQEELMERLRSLDAKCDKIIGTFR